MNHGRLVVPRYGAAKIFESDDPDSNIVLCRIKNDPCIVLEERKPQRCNNYQAEIKVLTAFGCGWVATREMRLI